MCIISLTPPLLFRTRHLSFFDNLITFFKYSSFKPSDNTTSAAQPQALSGDKKLNQEQDLPAINYTNKWSSPFLSISTTSTPMQTSTPTKSYAKHVYAKDAATIKPKEKFNNSVDKAKKS